jgi:hypothetical protein
MLRFDVIDFSRASVTPEGWIRDKPILSRAGVFTYTQPDGTVRKEYRPPEEVFAEAHLSSLRGVPVTDDHIERVADNPAVVGTVLTAGERADGDNLVAEVVIHQPARIGKRRELSLGYSIDLDETPGEADGQRYDAIQRKLRCTHVAVVHRGRAGNARLRLDRADAASAPFEPENSNMAEIRLDGGLKYEAPQEVAVAYQRALDDVAAQRKRADTAEAERDDAKAKAVQADAAVKQARADAATQVRARIELEGVATKHGVAVRADMDDRAIREAVIRKVRGADVKFDGRSDDYVVARFDSAIEDAARTDAVDAENAAAVNGASGTTRDDAASAAWKPGTIIRSSDELRARLASLGVAR